VRECGGVLVRMCVRLAVQVSISRSWLALLLGYVGIKRYTYARTLQYLADL